jgi:hypothetical protein
MQRNMPRAGADGGHVGRYRAARGHVERSNGTCRMSGRGAPLRFGELKVEARDEQHAFEIEVFLGDLDPAAIRVEIYAGGIMGGAPVRQAMERGRRPAGAPGGHVYGGDGVCRPSGGRLHRAGDAALRGYRDSSGGRSRPVAAMTWRRPTRAS